MPNTGFLIDMDGVIYREDSLLPGAAEFIEYLTVTATPFVFLTNNSAPTPDDLVVKLRHLGIGGLSPKHFYTSAMNTADFLAETHPTCTAFVLGEAGLTSALVEKRIHNDMIRPSYVVVGEGSPSSEKLAKAHELIEKGARLVATNPDNWCPVRADRTRPGAGAHTSFLEASSGKRAYYLGKPNPYMFIQARRRLLQRPSEVIMIGDTMETDIRGAIECGLQAYLVLTGSTSLEDLPNYVYQPTRIMEGVAQLLDDLKNHDGASDRLSSPAFSEPQRKEGDRHQVGNVVSMRRRRPAMTR